MKKTLLYIILHLIGGIAYCQQTSISEGEQVTVSSDRDYHRSIKGKGENIVFYTVEYNKHGVGGFATYTQTLVLKNYSKRGQKINEKKLNEFGKNISLKALQSNGDRLLMFTQDFDKDAKNTSFYCQPLNLTTFEPEGENKLLGTFDVSNLNAWQKLRRNGSLYLTPGGNAVMNQQNATFPFSKDSSHILMFVSAPNDVNANEKCFMAVYDRLMGKQWEKKVELPYLAKLTEITHTGVTNDGRVYVILKIFEKEPRGSSNHEDLPAFSIRALVFDKNNSSPILDYKPEIADKTIHSLELADYEAESFTFFGLYQQKASGNIQGYFSAAVSGKAITGNEKTYPFPTSLIEQVKKDKQATSIDKDPGIGNQFWLRKIMQRQSGGYDLLLEYAYETASVNYTAVVYGDVIDINIPAIDAEPTYTRIPRLIRIALPQPLQYFVALPYKDKLLVFLNDSDANLDLGPTEPPKDLRNSLSAGYGMHQIVIDSKGKIKRTSNSNILASALTLYIIDNNTLACTPVESIKGRGGFSATPNIITIR